MPQIGPNFTNEEFRDLIKRNADDFFASIEPEGLAECIVATLNKETNDAYDEREEIGKYIGNALSRTNVIAIIPTDADKTSRHIHNFINSDKNRYTKNGEQVLAIYEQSDLEHTFRHFTSDTHRHRAEKIIIAADATSEIQANAAIEIANTILRNRLHKNIYLIINTTPGHYKVFISDKLDYSAAACAERMRSRERSLDEFLRKLPQSNKEQDAVIADGISAISAILKLNTTSSNININNTSKASLINCGAISINHETYSIDIHHTFVIARAIAYSERHNIDEALDAATIISNHEDEDALWHALIHFWGKRGPDRINNTISQINSSRHKHTTINKKISLLSAIASNQNNAAEEARIVLSKDNITSNTIFVAKYYSNRMSDLDRHSIASLTMSKGEFGGRYTLCRIPKWEFDGVTIRNWQPTSCYLDEATIFGGEISETTLTLCSLKGTKISSTLITRLDVISSDADEILIANCTLTHCTIRASNLRGARINNSLFVDCTFDESIAHATILDNARFEECTFKDMTHSLEIWIARLHNDGIDLSTSTLNGCNIGESFRSQNSNDGE